MNTKFYKFFSLAIAFFGFVLPTLAATYYLNPNTGADTNTGLSAGQAWKSFDKVNASLFSPGDVIDGQGYTYSGVYNAGGNIVNQLIVPSSGSAGNPITFQNFTLDGMVSIDGSLSFNPTNTYSNTSAWILHSGEIYKKAMTRNPYQVTIDGVKVMPIIATTSADVLTLARGQWTYLNASSTMYYRAADGGAPSGHTLRMTTRTLDGQMGMIKTNGKSYLNFNNVGVQYYDTNTAPSAYGMLIDNSDHINLNTVTLYSNQNGLDILNSTNVNVATTTITYNTASGVLIEGNSSNLDISATSSENGRHGRYTMAAIDYPMDGDGIGIGGNQASATMSGITIHDSTFMNNGAPDGHANAYGTGVYVGTVFTFTISNLNIYRSKFQGNHDAGYNMGTVSGGFHGVNIIGNLFYNNLNSSASTANGVSVGTTCSDVCTGVNVQNNVIAGNLGNAGLYLNNANLNAAYKVQNNVFYNNGKTGTYRGDLWIQNAIANVTESNNHYYRSGTGWDTARVIERAGTTYDINHIIGGSAGFWQFDQGQGGSDAINQAEFTNPAAWDFTLLSNAAAINAGTAVPSRTTDILGNPIVGAMDIGAYEYQPPSYAITVTQTSNGTISPGTTSVVSGSNQTFTISPATGYSITSVTVDGVNQGAITSYTFTNVTATHTITATYAINTYAITVTQTANGTISPGTTSVNYGSSQTFNISPATGYSITSVTVDGVNQGAVSSYTFTNVRAVHTLSASFGAISSGGVAIVFPASTVSPSPAPVVVPPLTQTPKPLTTPVFATTSTSSLAVHSTSTPELFPRVLRYLMIGPDVLLLQQMLNTLGFIVSFSGEGSKGQESDYYGVKTQIAVQHFQCKVMNICNGIYTTTGFGRFGKATRAALLEEWGKITGQ